MKLVTFEIIQSICNPQGTIGCQRLNLFPQQKFTPCNEDNCKEWKLISVEDDKCPHCGKFLNEPKGINVQSTGLTGDAEERCAYWKSEALRLAELLDFWVKKATELIDEKGGE